MSRDQRVDLACEIVDRYASEVLSKPETPIGVQLSSLMYLQRLMKTWNCSLTLGFTRPNSNTIEVEMNGERSYAVAPQGNIVDAICDLAKKLVRKRIA